MMNDKKENKSKTKEDEMGWKIRDLRLKMSLTQEQFAAKVGVTFSTVNRWENGRGKPSPLAVRQIQALAKKLKAG